MHIWKIFNLWVSSQNEWQFLITFSNPWTRILYLFCFFESTILYIFHTQAPLWWLKNSFIIKSLSSICVILNISIATTLLPMTRNTSNGPMMMEPQTAWIWLTGVVQWVFLYNHMNKGMTLSSKLLRLLLLTLGSHNNTATISIESFLIQILNLKLLLVISILHSQLKFWIFSLARCEYRNLMSPNQKFWTKCCLKFWTKYWYDFWTKFWHKSCTKSWPKFWTKSCTNSSTKL